MGIQVMGSQGCGGQQSQLMMTFGRQPSTYGFTSSEMQNQLEEPLQSMNLEELLGNVMSPEEDRPFAACLESSSSRNEGDDGMQLIEGDDRKQPISCKKTAEQVWRDIQHAGGNKCANGQLSVQGRHPTHGEMTLEDFLAKVGIVAEMPEKIRNDQNGDLVHSVDPVLGSHSHQHTPGMHWLQHFNPLSSSCQGQQQQSEPVYAPPSMGTGNVFDSAYSDNQNSNSSSVMVPFRETQARARKRVAPEEIVERTVERRQKRMIKNRESAARSRARKQAYTNELENKVARLEEENARLKQQKKLDKLLFNAWQPEPTKSRLRRTSSALF